MVARYVDRSESYFLQRLRKILRRPEQGISRIRRFCHASLERADGSVRLLDDILDIPEARRKVVAVIRPARIDQRRMAYDVARACHVDAYYIFFRRLRFLVG